MLDVRSPALALINLHESGRVVGLTGVIEVYEWANGSLEVDT